VATEFAAATITAIQFKGVLGYDILTLKVASHFTGKTFILNIFWWNMPTKPSDLQLKDIKILSIEGEDALEVASGVFAPPPPPFASVTTQADEIVKIDLETAHRLCAEAKAHHENDFLFLTSGPAHYNNRYLMLQIDNICAIETPRKPDRPTCIGHHWVNMPYAMTSIHLTQADEAALKIQLSQKGYSFEHGPGMLGGDLIHRIARDTRQALPPGPTNRAGFALPKCVIA
jgi:hypothetical protein